MGQLPEGSIKLIETVEEVKKVGLSNKITKVAITVSNLPDFRSKFIELENDQFQLLSLIHETAVVGENAEIGDGTILFANVHIGADTKIGKCAITVKATAHELW